jgi:hypothetical protein
MGVLFAQTAQIAYCRAGDHVEIDLPLVKQRE